MARSQADRLGDSNHSWRSNGFKGYFEPKFLLQFAHYGDARVFIRFDVTASWQPKLRVLVVNKQDVPAVYDREVRNQMLWRHRRLAYAKETGTRIDPSNGIFEMRLLHRVQWLDFQ